MTVGLPGAGIGGLFYIVSTLVLPIRSLTRRVRRRPDSVSHGQLVHSLFIVAGIIGGLWLVGWLLAIMVPDEILQSATTSAANGARAHTGLPTATFAVAAGTLLAVLGAVEIARIAHSRRQALLTPRENRTI